MAEVSEQQEQNVSENNKAHKSRSGLWFGIIMLLVILSVAGAGFYFLQQLRSQQDNLGGEVNKGDMQLIELSKQISGYQAQLAAIQSQLATVESDVAGKESHFSQTLEGFSKLHNEKLDSTRNELNTAITQVQRQLGKTRGDWLIADAEYLLSIANQRLYLMGDVNTTREALEAADQRLRESGDAGAFKVREQIAKDITAIRNVAVADIVGMYASIQSLQDQVDSLTLLLPYTGKTLTPPRQAPEPANKEDQTLLDSALGQLEGVVTLRHTEHPIKEILTPEEAQFIREQLRVKLEMVKIALVQQNERLYQSGLADAKKWTEQNFAKNAETGNFIGELDKFSAIKIRSHFPDISMSLKMLRDITKLRLEADKALAPAEKTKNEQTVTTPPAEPQKPVETAPAAQ
ncbi:uroporphyrinogen-III C-methyltransferase [Candidatus Methylobacter oryzae]|uniref:Enzyme of heme biosynthesis n=1 Tax=Candidatus Methylobacter oryzae TaxID=2497749 RepID=A0ABY3C846_9GAMM|nr:uroporphyrinogen-III C-methyltransferase [Candidatus Methylobacter oryzae]TRW91318.1 enzyme of heme biosynthesis [Candidatus Methylobacter oryzae]